jgi:hypothetical protein
VFARFETLDAQLPEMTSLRAIASLPKRVPGRYNVHMQLKTAKRMYVFVGVLGVIVGGAYFFQRHYFFGAIYALFGVIWLLMSRKTAREETAVQPAGMDLGSPAQAAEQRISTAENISKLPRS